MEDKNKKPTITEEDLGFIKNAMARRQCYNCALMKECEAKDPRYFEPIGTCNNWTEKA